MPSQSKGTPILDPRLCALLELLALLPAWSTLLAQTDSGATIAGSVLDQAGKSIQGAAVTIKNEATATTRALVTDSDGHFSVSGLPAGIYTIETMAPGFARNRRTGIRRRHEINPAPDQTTGCS